MSVSRLSPENQDQVISFLKFFRSKRDVSLDQISADFRDTKNDSLTEDMYTVQEVEKGYDSMSLVVQDTTRNEIGSIINMCVLLLTQLFTQADDEGVELEMDTALVEDQRLLEEVEKMTLDKNTNNMKKGMRLKDTLAQTKKDLMQAESDRDLAQGKLKNVSKKYKAEQKMNDDLNHQIMELQAKLKKAKKERKASITAAANEEKEEEESKEDSPSKPVAEPTLLVANAYENEIESDEEGKGQEFEDLTPTELIGKYKKAKKYIAELKNDLDKRLNDSKQFKSLKQMMMDKNALLSKTRVRLEKYEPDGVEEEEM